MRILIDGDVIVYRAGFAAEKAEYGVSWFDKEFDEARTTWTPSAADRDALLAKLALEGVSDPIVERVRRAEPVQNAIYNAKSIIATCVASLHGDISDVTTFLSGPTNFRNEVATIKKYKGNREKSEKPTHTKAIRDYIENAYDCNMSVDEEADDQLGIVQTATIRATGDDWSSVICTVDKDLDMIPGLHYNFVKDEAYFVDERTAIWYFYRQLLTGDSTDNIPGLAGVGKKRAEAILGEAGQDELCMYNTVRQAYADKYPDDVDDVLLENARLLWIRREPNELWEPPA